MDKTMRGKTRDSVRVENGDCLSKMPTATAEQLNIAKVLSKPGEDMDLRNHVAQLQELTACTEDQAVTALYDCENNLERAVELLLDKLRFGTDEEWYTTGKKTSRIKQSRNNDSEPSKHGSSVSTEHDHEVNNCKDTGLNEFQKKSDSTDSKIEPSVNRLRRRDIKKSSSSGLKVFNISETSDDSRRSPVTAPSDSKPRSRLPRSDAWDPYTEYGEWGGEAIEIVNSNASISCGLQEDVPLSEDTLVNNENHDVRSSFQPPVEKDERVSSSPIKNSDSHELTSVFITKAQSRPPPPAFTNFPDVPVFIVPDLLPNSIHKWPFKLCGELSTPFRDVAVHSATNTALSPKEDTNAPQQSIPLNNTKGRTDVEPQEFSQLMPSPSPSKTKASALDVSKPSNRNLIDSASAPDSKRDIASTPFHTTQFQSTAANHKSTGSFSQKSQAAQAYASEGSNSQSNFLDSSLKNYILDNLPSEMSKLSVSEPAHVSKASQYSLQTVPQTATTSFSHNQAGTNSVPHPVNKGQLPLISPHGSVHTTQQSVVSTASQSQQQSAPVPPGMPHFIGQFAPPAYMFNLPGNSGNAPTIFDIDQFQLLQQQQRMLYDMHLQQQAATTSQSLLTSTADASTSGKSSTQAGNLGHVNPTNPGIRPDILASAIGHAPQLMPTGHPYFSYPGFVVMNGYSNAFLNQQQQQQSSGQDGAQNQGGTGHGNSSMTSHQQQSNNPSQSYSNLKSANSNVAAYDDLFDMKYGDPSKQVGFKTTSPNYPSFQGHLPSNEMVGSKLPSATHPNSGVLTQGFTTNSGAGQPFSPQFYSSAPYLTAVAAVAAAAAASAQHQQQVPHPGNNLSGGGNQSNTNGPSVNQGAGGPNPLHPPSGPAQAMVLGSGNTNLHSHHHQRSVMPQQF